MEKAKIESKVVQEYVFKDNTNLVSVALNRIQKSLMKVGVRLPECEIEPWGKLYIQGHGYFDVELIQSIKIMEDLGRYYLIVKGNGYSLIFECERRIP
jgi:hypothetical protein